MERGIATLTHQSLLPTLLSLSSHGSHKPDNSGAREIGTSTVDAVLSRTGVPGHGEELEGGFYDYEDEDEELR